MKPVVSELIIYKINNVKYKVYHAESNENKECGQNN